MPFGFTISGKGTFGTRGPDGKPVSGPLKRSLDAKVKKFAGPQIPMGPMTFFASTTASVAAMMTGQLASRLGSAGAAGTAVVAVAACSLAAQLAWQVKWLLRKGKWDQERDRKASAQEGPLPLGPDFSPSTETAVAERLRHAGMPAWSRIASSMTEKNLVSKTEPLSLPRGWNPVSALARGEVPRLEAGISGHTLRWGEASWDASWAVQWLDRRTGPEDMGGLEYEGGSAVVPSLTAEYLNFLAHKIRFEPAEIRAPEFFRHAYAGGYATPFGA